MTTVSATPKLGPAGALTLCLLLAACAARPPAVPPAAARGSGGDGAAPPVGACAPAPTPLPAARPAAFAWRNPLPQGDSLLAVWGAAPDLVWAVGDRGRVLHFDGAAWTLADPGPTDYLAGVWGSGPDDLFVTGYNGRVLRFDGARWWLHPTGVSNDFNGIWGSGPNDVFTVGDRGVILHYDGRCWRRQETGTEDLFFGVWGSGPGDVWAVGGRGNVAHFDGTAWRAEDVSALAPDAHFVGVWGPGPGDVYVAGTGGTVLHREGGAWRREDVGTDQLLRWVWGTGADDVWVAGDEGTVRRFDGAAWRRVDPGAPEATVRGGWRAGPGGPTYLVGDDGLLLVEAEGPFRPARTGPVADLYAVDGPWAAGDGGAVLFRDAANRWHPVTVPAEAPFLALVVLVDGRVLAGGTDGLWIGDGRGWRRLPWPPGVPVGTVYGIASWGRRAVAVGGAEGGSLVVGFDGDRLVALPSPGTGPLFGVNGPTADAFVAVGAGGAAHAYQEGRWQDLPVPGGEDLTAVSRLGIAVGAMGGVYLRVKGGWKALQDPGGFALYAVVDDPRGGAWAVGDFGQVRRIEGDQVREVPVPTGRALHAVAVAPDGRVTLAGEGGTVLERPPRPGGVKIK